MGRNSRETTPCSLIKDSEPTRTPCLTTRSVNTPRERPSGAIILESNVKASPEMEEFLAGAEQIHQRIFLAKYNFDPVNDRPLPGRYEWVKLDA